MAPPAPPTTEVNFDGLVGPTHNYAGLSLGNTASTGSAGGVSSPKRAALQGLAKARALADRGLPQGILPPQARPDTRALRALGVGRDGDPDEDVLRAAWDRDPALVALVSSASAMWTANAATVCPSADADDGRAHLTPANLRSMPHRSIEAGPTTRILRAVFPDPDAFAVHDPLPMGGAFDDEGAANHTRLELAGRGVHLFVHGRGGGGGGGGGDAGGGAGPRTFPARQTLEASEAVARLNRVPPDRCVFARQRPEAIDAGVFHNDVIAVGHGNVLLHHEAAFADEDGTLGRLAELGGGGLVAIRVTERQVGLATAVRTYLFNSQLVTMPEGHMALVAPEQCREDPDVRRFVDGMLAHGGNPVEEVLHFDLLQSMKNGGGPACLRLRVPLTGEELAKVAPGCLLTDALHRELVRWVGRHYRDELAPADLASPALLQEGRRALAELADVLRLPPSLWE